MAKTISFLFFACIVICKGNCQVPALPVPFSFDKYQQLIGMTSKPKAIGNPDVFNLDLITKSLFPTITSTSTGQLRIPPPGASPEVQRQYADADIRQLEIDRQMQAQRLNEASAAIDELHIDYELPFLPNDEKKRYGTAFNELERMLKGEQPINLSKAVFLVESAFDRTISYNEFDKKLSQSANIVGLAMEKDKISATDNVGKILATFRFMSDTISVKNKLEGSITSYPKTYDFEDFWGRQDYRKMFVSKLLREGSGQCHSLPLLFLMLCEKIGADANLAFAPNHSFVKFRDRNGKWHNLELTNAMLASDHFMIESGYIKAEALQNRIYLEPITKKQLIAQCLNDLAMGYQKKFGYDLFTKECSKVALEHFPNSLTAMQSLANYQIALSNYIAYQYEIKGLSKYQLQKDTDAQKILTDTKAIIQKIDNLGYSEIPPEAYERWLKSAQKESVKQQHTKELKVLGGVITR